LFVLIRLSLHFLMPVSIPSTTGFCFHQFHLRLQISYSRFFCFRISVGATLPRREPRNYLLALAGLAISFAVPSIAQDAMKVVTADVLVWKEHPVFKGAAANTPSSPPKIVASALPESRWIFCRRQLFLAELRFLHHGTVYPAATNVAKMPLN
jgi:hypothetical protein